MTDPVENEDESTEDTLFRWLGEHEPFYDDRVEILASLIVAELDEQLPLPEAEQNKMLKEIIELVERWELAQPEPKKTDVN